MTRIVAPYRDLSPAERIATREAADELLGAVVAGREEGWLPHENDPLISCARDLGVRLWPALIRQLNRRAFWLARATHHPHPN